MSNIIKSLNQLKSQQWIDLSHEVSDSIPYFQSFKPLSEKTLFTVENDGFYAKEYSIVSQYATHIDAPVHFASGKRYLTDIDLKDFMLPLVVINKEAEVKQNHDYALTVDDILQFEAEHGNIPAGCFVAFASGWSKRWHDHDAFYNRDESGQAHTPGWSLEALTFLHEQRDVLAIGHETLDTDTSVDCTKNKGLIAELYWLSQDKYQVEVLNNLTELPPTGAVIVLGVPKIKNSPGFNVRVFAIVPNK